MKGRILLFTALTVQLLLADSISFAIKDPLFPTDEPRQCTLVSDEDAHGQISGYHMRLMTDVCLDRTCRMIDVTLYWDAIGRYLKLEPSRTFPLTKLNHQPFTATDYRDLDAILRDPHSILQNYSAGDIDTSSAEEVDAVSGATATDLNRQVVQGAAYTCWLLWHWTNGEVADRIRRVTEDAASPRLMNEFLGSSDPDKVRFAIELLQKQRFDGDFTGSAIAALSSGDYETSRLLFQYLTGKPSDSEKLAVELAGALGSVSTHAERQILDWLKSQEPLKPEVLQVLTDRLPQLSYMGVHGTLEILSQSDGTDPEVLGKISALTNSPNPFVVRRIRSYLSQEN
jgi:hypothetical protein